MRTKLAIAGGALGVGVFFLLRFFEIWGLRDTLLGLLVALAPPVAITLRRLERYAPEARTAPRLTWLSVALGIPLGLAIFFVWRLFPDLYTYALDYVGGPRESYTPYLSEFQESISAFGTLVASLTTMGLLFAGQLALWVVPSYWLASRIALPIEQALDKKHRAEQAPPRLANPMERAPSRIARFKEGNERVYAKVRMRTYAMMICLSSSLVTMNLVAWLGMLR